MFFETTIMGKTADLPIIQKTNIDTLHKRASHRGSLLKGCSCLQSAVSKILNAKLTGRKNLGRKRCTSNRMTASLRIQSSKADFKHLWELHKEWTEAGVSASRVTTLRCLQEKGYQATSEPETTSEGILPGLWRKRTGLLLSGPKSLFRWKSILHFIWKSGPRVWSGEAQNPCCLKSSVKFPQSMMIWAAMSSAGVGPLCFLKSTVNAAIYQEILEHFMIPSADKIYGDADFHFPAGLGTCPHCQRYQKLVQWPWCYCAWLASKLAWPEPHRESIGYYREEDERHQTQ